MEFIKKEELKLVNGGYLVNNEGKPVYNEEFVKAQQEAHMYFELLEIAKTKNTARVERHTLQDVYNDYNRLKENKIVDVAYPITQPKQELTEKLKQEALHFIDYKKKDAQRQLVNQEMQKFLIIKEFEEFGLFFSSDKIVKLDKIYTFEEILDIVTKWVYVKSLLS